MSSSTFLVLAGTVLLATFLAGLLRRSPAPPAPKPVEEVKRWAVFRLHLGRLIAGDATVAEGLPGGPALSRKGSVDARRPNVLLAGRGGQPEVAIRAARRLGRAAARIAIDGAPLAELRGGRRGTVLEALRSESIDFTVSGDAAALELEVRRGPKLIASVSPEIAPAEDAVGVEVLIGEDPVRILAVVAGIAILRSLTPEAAPKPEAPEKKEEKKAGAGAAA
jgi:hypothetical protein